MVQHLAEIPNINIKVQELSDRSHVSMTSIIRFCKKNGFSVFSEFKFRWKIYIESQPDESSLSSSTIGQSIETLINMRVANIDNNIEKAAQAIAKAEETIFIGIGTSGILANYASRFLLSLGIFSSCINDSFFPTQTSFHGK
ncbi:hypothetical protein R5R49_08770 [Oenococcus oeni]